MKGLCNLSGGSIPKSITWISNIYTVGSDTSTNKATINSNPLEKKEKIQMLYNMYIYTAGNRVGSANLYLDGSNDNQTWTNVWDSGTKDNGNYRATVTDSKYKYYRARVYGHRVDITVALMNIGGGIARAISLLKNIFKEEVFA